MVSTVAEKSNKSLQMGVVLIVVAVLAGAGFLTAGVILTVNQLGRADWPQTTGTVTAFTRTIDEDSNGHNYTAYGEVVTYEVDGRSYTHRPQSESKHPNPIGTTVTVHYDPNDPSRSHVGGEDWWFELAMFAAGVFFIALMGGFGLSVVRTEIKARRLRESVEGPRS